MLLHRVVLAASCSAWLVTAATAFAQTDPDELARRHFESGAAYFEQGEYESSLREFKQAYELSRRVELLLNLASVHERLGQLALAVARLDEYLAEHEEPTVRLRRNNLKSRLDQQNQTMPMADLQADGVATDPVPAPSASANQAAAPRAPASLPPRPNRTLGLVFLGVGGASAAAALVTNLLALSEFDRDENRCGDLCSDEQIAKFRRLRTASVVLSGAALVTGGLGVYLYLNPSYESPSPSGFNVGVRSRGEIGRAHV